MARRRFFVDEIRRGAAELTGPDAEHLVRVLRVEQGQVFELSDNRELYLAEIETARKSTVSFRILEKLPAPEAEAELILAPALFKFERFEWLMEKATELGVSAIQPWEAIHSERGLAQAAFKRRSRWEKIGRESSQQSRRAHLPRIEPVVRLRKILEIDVRLRLLLDEDSSAPPILGVLPIGRKPTDRVALLLGPEGGWTEDERNQALKAGWIACSLGPTVLRAETAGIAALAVLRAAWQSSPGP
ncbi:MAG: 16S rRNA (uracil(1498)-N(3))-methyltransferase [Acidobacteriota bacterium]|nr:16S rRNA (uracil(1498)-N(3))-methyltransferase [Acidobacteriota bacterium]